MAIQTQTVEYKDGDVLLEGYLAWDDTNSDRRPGVLISHAWAGRSEFEDGKAESLAELGYAGFALDLYGKGIIDRHEVLTRCRYPDNVAGRIAEMEISTPE